MEKKDSKKDLLIRLIVKKGWPKEFGELIAEELKTENAQRRMVGYLLNGNPRSMEQVADEMLAILEEHNAWRQKKITEYNNAQYNEMLLHGLRKK